MTATSTPKDTLLLVQRPGLTPVYVRTLGRDGSFEVTHFREKARRFTAAAAIAAQATMPTTSGLTVITEQVPL